MVVTVGAAEARAMMAAKPEAVGLLEGASEVAAMVAKGEGAEGAGTAAPRSRRKSAHGTGHRGATYAHHTFGEGTKA